MRRFPLADDPIFVAECASTCNEALVIDYMLKEIKDDATRLSRLGSYLEGAKATVFRQTQFAEFELRMHEMAAEGHAITGDVLAELYMGIAKRYYGHDAGVVVADYCVSPDKSHIHLFSRYHSVITDVPPFPAHDDLSLHYQPAHRRQRPLRRLAAGWLRTWCSWTRRGRTPPCSVPTATPQRAKGWWRRPYWGAGRR